jgi:hypothetical protein
MSNKRHESNELDYYVNQWKHGNVIQIPLTKFISNYDDPSGVRCYICDWSPYNNKSLYNPEAETYTRNFLQNDYDGKPVCSACQRIIGHMKPSDKDTPISKYMIDKDIRGLEIFDSEDDEADHLAGDAVYDPSIGQFSGSRKVPVRYG